MNKKITIIAIFSIIIFLFTIKQNNYIKNQRLADENTISTSSQSNKKFEQPQSEDEYSEKNTLNSTEDVNLLDLNGNEKNFSFTYKNETFSAIYSTDNWHIIDSYKITNYKDIVVICQALIDIHPIHGSDMESYRTAEDMAHEWIQHNLAYEVLPENNSWKKHAQNVDLNPEDQGKTLLEMYKSRIK